MGVDGNRASGGWRGWFKRNALWVWSGRLEFAVWAGIFALFYQVLATQMQAEALSWQLLTSGHDVGDFGKVKALEQLNRDSTIGLFPVPDMPSWYPNWLRIPPGDKDRSTFWIDNDGWLRMPFLWLFRNKTDLRGLVLSPIYERPDKCPDGGADLAGLQLREGKLDRSDFSCVTFGPRVDPGSENADRSGFADFTHASLNGAKFRGSVLPSAKFNSAQISDTNFEYADLTQAQFNGAEGARVSMRRLRFQGAQTNQYVSQRREKITEKDRLPAALPTTKNLVVSPIASSNKSCLDDLCFVAACVDDSYLDFGQAERVISADFRGASLRATTIFGGTLSANFSALTEDEIEMIKKGTFLACPIRQSSARDVSQQSGNREVKLKNSDRGSNKCNSAKPTGADLTDSILKQIDWTYSDFTGAELCKTDLSGTNLRSTTGITAEMLSHACTDEFTLLPKYTKFDPNSEFDPKLEKNNVKFDKSLYNQLTTSNGIQSTCGKHRSAVGSSVTPNPRCVAELGLIPNKFVGTLKQIEQEVLTVQVTGCGSEVELSDVILQQELRKLSKRDEASRENALNRWAAQAKSEHLQVKCVLLNVPDAVRASVGTGKAGNTDTTFSNSAGALSGWCSANPSGGGQVPIHEALEALHEKARKDQQETDVSVQGSSPNHQHSGSTDSVTTGCTTCRE